MAVVARGTGATLVQPATVQRLTAAERAHPRGTRWQWQGQWTVVTLPVLGPVHTGAVAAAAVNTAWRNGRLVSDGHPMPLWPGARTPATYDPRTRRVTVRWVGSSAYIGGIVAALSGITAGFLAATLGLSAAAAAAVGLGVALVVGVAFVVDYLITWTFGTVGTSGRPSPAGALGLGLLAAAVIVGVPVVAALASGRRRSRAR